jgi:hypothetical protein
VLPTLLELALLFIGNFWAAEAEDYLLPDI